MSDEELRALAEKATPGPWCVPDADDEYVGPYDVVSVGAPGERYVICEHAGQDADFIAAASPDRILALLDRLARVEAQLQYAACPTMGYPGGGVDPADWAMEAPEHLVRLALATCIRGARAVLSESGREVDQ